MLPEKLVLDLFAPVVVMLWDASNPHIEREMPAALEKAVS
jgi:hypothetical protein